ncbi:hypothetical protein L208DRAFT_1269849 [Tricholoma matsutake]|nr:hypothetical protein L208DRAFT_1269849 [Tricholoma matsutake 945]
MTRCISGILTFCCRCSSKSSSSANFFFVTGIPILVSPSFPLAQAPTKASNQGFMLQLTNAWRLS